MRNIFGTTLLIAILLLAATRIAAQEYQTKNNILYRTAEETQADAYINERCRLDVYYPGNVKDFTTVVWFHGGGLEGGEKYIPETWKNKGIAVVAVNYRLHPKVKCPVYIEDAAAAVAWVLHHIAEFGGNPDKIVVSGHSAGGYLASMTGLDKKWLAKYDIDADKIAMLIPFSGHTITHMTIRKERGISDKQPVVDEFAPLWHVRSDAPPLVLITGDRELEMLGRYEENAYMMRMMKIAGHTQTKLYELDGFDHGGMASPAYEILLNEIKSLSK
ncbi:MAG TPA: lipase [Prolixibacteraceae bacterium]|nr:lipase [Prolixibacteraceae bacterium]